MNNYQSIYSVFKKVLNNPVFRIAVGIVLLNVGLFIIRNLVQLVLSSLNINNDIVTSTCIFVFRIIGLVGIYSLYVWMYERRKPVEMAFSQSTANKVIFGSIIGFLCIGSVIGFNYLFGWISIENLNRSPDILNGVYYTIFFVLLQDITYFLIIFRITERYLGTYITIVLTGLIFGFKHLLFPNYLVISGIFIFIDATFIFSALYLRSRSIWEIFGFHLVYNFTQNIIFGNPVMEEMQSVFDISTEGPVIFTGDQSGFETSIIAVIFCVAVGLCYLNKIRKKELFLYPYWKKHH